MTATLSSSPSPLSQIRYKMAIDELSRDRILDETYEILIEKGIKSTTMDTVAKRLKISKRTLYEIFENKNDLIVRAFERHSLLQRLEAERLMGSSENIMEGLMKVILLHRDDISRVNIEFFRDMDRLYPAMREGYEERRMKVRAELIAMFKTGVSQGFFREDINFPALSYIVELFMESLKRMENKIPENMKLVDIFDTLTLTFIRTIATPAGLEYLESGKCNV